MQNWYKNAFVDATMLFWTSLNADLSCFCRTVVKQDSNRSSSPHHHVSVVREATEQTYRLWKPIDTRLDMCDANIQKHQFSNLPAY